MPDVTQGVVLVEDKLGVADWALKPLYKVVSHLFFQGLARHEVLTGLVYFTSLHFTSFSALSRVLMSTLCVLGAEKVEFVALLRSLLLLNAKVATAWNILSVNH
jgi:hypothetical protein